MAKIHSNYLNMDFDVEFNAMEQGDSNEDIENIVSHKSLKEIIHNQVPVAKGVSYVFEHFPNTHHPVVACTMSDKTGRKVQTIGEAMPSTLLTEVAKMYPTVIAAQRAFDRAATEYLALPSKIVDVKAPVARNVQNVNTRVSNNTSASPRNNNVKSEMYEDEDLEVVDDAVISCADVLDEELHIEDELRESPAEDDTSIVGDTLISLGKYKNKPEKLSVIYETNKRWLEYVTSKTPITDANREQIEAGKKYIALMEKGGK